VVVKLTGYPVNVSCAATARISSDVVVAHISVACNFRNFDDVVIWILIVSSSVWSFEAFYVAGIGHRFMYGFVNDLVNNG
jgi:hypothetical protein